MNRQGNQFPTRLHCFIWNIFWICSIRRQHPIKQVSVAAFYFMKCFPDRLKTVLSEIQKHRRVQFWFQFYCLWTAWNTCHDNSNDSNSTGPYITAQNSLKHYLWSQEKNCFDSFFESWTRHELQILIVYFCL